MSEKESGSLRLASQIQSLSLLKMSMYDDGVQQDQENLNETDTNQDKMEDDDDDYDCDDKSLDPVNGQSQQKMDFDVLDDLNEDDDEDEDGDESSDDGWDDSEEDVPIEEIDAMLDQKLDEYRARKCFRSEGDECDDDEMAHEEREKVVLKVRGQDHFEVLPEGWIEVTHNSGMPVYLHKSSRVCTLSKPYFLGPGSARKHEVPIATIPCLHYRRELEREQTQAQQREFEVLQQPLEASNCNDSMDSVLSTGSASKSNQNLPSAKIETVQENTKEKSIDYMALRKYCEKLFEFKTIKVRRFKTWAGRRKHQKRMKQMHRPTLPLGTKLITCPLPPAPDKEAGASTNPRRSEFVMNPNGKSYVCILHEYVQHTMRVQPRYVFRELENASNPYGATVFIIDVEYGSGFGSSKKHAKLAAAKATLEVLIPQMKHINPDDKIQNMQQQGLDYFDNVRVEDPRVSELCAKAGQPSPYQILLECLKRNYGMGDTQIKFDMHTLKHQKNEFTMTVGKRTAQVLCKNKRDGKQRASQTILQALHPHINSWGSLLRLYGKGSCKTLKEKKQEEQEITELQCRTTANKPNQSILKKLREEMLKLKEKRESTKPIGKFEPTDIEPPSSSGSNLKNIDL